MARIHEKRALAFVGTPFRPQGRRKDGIDCVGLCLAAYRLPDGAVRSDYRLRGNHRAEAEAVIASHFRKTRSGGHPGDLLVMQPAPGQLHLGVLTKDGFVHADARLRRVVETPGVPAWPVIGIYRRRNI